jgi:hypothetical protein
MKHIGVFVVGFDAFDLAHIMGKGASGLFDAREPIEERTSSLEVRI